MTRHQRTWSVWLFGVLSTFAWWEYKALRSRKPDVPSGTLTATMRFWLGVDPRCRRRFVMAPLFAAFLGWMGGHFLFGIWGWKPK